MSQSHLYLRRSVAAFIVATATVCNIIIVLPTSIHFWLEIVKNALDLTVHSTFATSYAAVVRDLVVVVFVGLRIKRREGRQGMNLWISKGKDTAIAVATAFLLTFAYHAAVTVPNSIRNANMLSPGRPKALGPPPAPYPLERTVHATGVKPAKVLLIFKDSVSFTDKRKAHISNTIDGVYLHLTKLGFELPNNCPPIGVVPGKVFHAAGTYPDKIYYQFFMLPEERIDDEKLIRWAYAQEVFKQLFYQNPLWAERMGFPASDLFSQYYASSVSGSRFGTNNPLLNKLWLVREKEGQSFTDRAMFYTYKIWFDHPPFQEEKGNFERFLISKFLLGVYVVSNGGKQIGEVEKILASTNEKTPEK